MSKNVTNSITFEGKNERIVEMLETVKIDNYRRGSIDFNKLIPRPASLNIEEGSDTNEGLKAYKEFIEVYKLKGKMTKEELLSIPEEKEKIFLRMRKDIPLSTWKLGRTAYRNLLQYGAPTWYEWDMQNWGTKWNAYIYEEGEDYSQSKEIRFDTANTAPHPVLKNPDIAALPEDSLRFIDRREAGAWLREQEGGVYIDGKYIVTGEYRYTEIYDGITLPEQEREDRYVFRIGIAAEENGEAKQWISLPAMRLEADRLAKSLGAEKIENCACVGFESAIPQIEEKDIGDLNGFAKWNFIASQYIKMSPAYRMKYKAVLYRRDRFDLDYALESLRQLDRYELDPGVEYADDYFREYLCRHLDARFDTEWLDNMNLQREGQTLKEKTGTKLTPYGAVSAPDHPLYKNVPRREQIDFREERMDAVELFGQKVLFIDRRIKPNDIAEGLYKYELREAENGEFATLEERVAINFAGTILTKTPIDLGRDGYRDLDEETSPNLLGYEQTMREYMEEQDQTEQQTEGVITQ